METDNIIVNFLQPQQLQDAFGSIRMFPNQISSGNCILMAKDENFVADAAASIDPFADRKALVKKIDMAMCLAAEEARQENDQLGIPTPVGIKGKVAYRLRGKLITPENNS